MQSQILSLMFQNLDSDSSLWVLLTPFALGLIVFVVYYWWIFTKYRNTDKSYRYEQETEIKVSNAQAFDDPFRVRRGVRSPIMTDRNNGQNRQRIRRVQLGE